MRNFRHRTKSEVVYEGMEAEKHSPNTNNILAQNLAGKTISESLINIMIMFVSFYRTKHQSHWKDVTAHLMTAIMLSDQLFVIGRNLKMEFFFS